jgi:hypothetical protein
MAKPTRKEIVRDLLSLRSVGESLHDVWRSDEDICRILKRFKGYTLDTHTLNKAVSGLDPTKGTVDNERDGELLGIWRKHFNISNDDGDNTTRMYFYYIKKKKKPKFSTKIEDWQKAYKKIDSMRFELVVLGLLSSPLRLNHHRENNNI